MDDQTIDQLTPITVPTGATLYATKEVSGVRGDYKITYENLTKTIRDNITAILAITNKLPTRDIRAGITSAAIISLPSDTLIDKITVIATAGTPILKLGTTVGGDEILEDQVIDGSTNFNFNDYIKTTETWHLTVTGGTITIIIVTENDISL